MSRKRVALMRSVVSGWRYNFCFFTFQQFFLYILIYMLYNSSFFYISKYFSCCIFWSISYTDCSNCGKSAATSNEKCWIIETSEREVWGNVSLSPSMILFESEIFAIDTDNDISQGILLPLLGFFGLSGNLVSIIVLSTPEMAANFFNR